MSTFEFDDGIGGRLRGTLHAPGATPGDVLTVGATHGTVSPAPGGGSIPGNARWITRVVTAAMIAAVFDTNNGWADIELFTPDEGATLHLANAYKTIDWDNGIASCGVALGLATDFPFDDSSPATLSGGFTAGWNFDPGQGLEIGTKALQVADQPMVQPASPFGNTGSNFGDWHPIRIVTPEPLLARFVMPDSGDPGPFTAPVDGSVTVKVWVEDPPA